MKGRVSTSSDHFHGDMPGLRVCTTSRKANKSKKSRAKRHHPPPSDNLTYDTSIAHLKIVPRISHSGKAKIKLVEDYDHLLGRHCTELLSTVPWLSLLPDNVISRILSFLPLKEAGQTSILSKRWRFLWSFMPMLKFPTVASVVFVTNVLKLFKAPRVEVLRLSTKIVGRCPTRHEINSWLSLACSRDVKDLTLKLLFTNPCSCQVPYFLHWRGCAGPGFSTIKRLVVGSCLFGPPAFKHLISLECLVIKNMLLDDNMVEEITSSCPMLQELELMDCNLSFPLRVSITNPKTYKLTFHDSSCSTSVLELYAPYLTTLIFTSNFWRRLVWNMPSLSIVKIAFPNIPIFFNPVNLVKVVSDLDATTELYLSSSFLQCLYGLASAKVRLLATPMKVKCLHVQANDFSYQLPGLIQFLRSSAGIETLVLDFEMCLEIRKNLAKHLIYLNTALLKDTHFEIKDKNKVVCLDEKHSWGSLRFLLSSQMSNLKCVVINGFKRMYKIGKACNNDIPTEVCYAVGKFEFKLLRLLLKYSLSLKKITISTKDVHLIEEVNEAVMVKCKKLYMNHEVRKMEIPQWNKMLLSLPRCSPRAKINIIN